MTLTDAQINALIRSVNVHKAQVPATARQAQRELTELRGILRDEAQRRDDLRQSSFLTATRF